MNRARLSGATQANAGSELANPGAPGRGRWWLLAMGTGMALALIGVVMMSSVPMLWPRVVRTQLFAGIVMIVVGAVLAASPLATSIKRWLLPWALLLFCCNAMVFLYVLRLVPIRSQVVWEFPWAAPLTLSSVLAAAILFARQSRGAPVLGFPTIAFAQVRTWRWWLSDVPSIMRVLALTLIALSLTRPRTYKNVIREIDSIDIMIVFDASKSMEEADMGRDRFDVAQRVVRHFLRRSKEDRVGLVVFATKAMLQSPLTSDTRSLDQMVADLQIGDVPEMGTAIGDGLALGLAQLRRVDTKSKVVILLSDGDTNSDTQFDTDEASALAKKMGVKVYTVLVGQPGGIFGGNDVDPATLMNISKQTGGLFFQASDESSFERGFDVVRRSLDKTKRKTTERIADHELFVWFLVPALLLLILEKLMLVSYWRRFP
jgi:Ca-activated chloride channel homolog